MAKTEGAVDWRRLVGLAGVLLAAMVAQFNDQVATVALADIAGAIGLSEDTASWLPTLYVAGEVCGMVVAPQLGVGFTLRRFALFAITLSCVPTLLIPLLPQPPTLLALRLLQGLASGFTIPLLMTVALRVLDPPIRLYGLAVYALTATFTPNLATSLAALWTDGIGDWRFVFFEALPFCALAAVLVWWGMDQDQPDRERLAKFDWPGALLVAIGFGSLSVVLEQGDRLDWFNSHLIATLSLVSAVAIPLFVVREFYAEVPLIRFDILIRRNFAYAAITLILFLIVSLAASQVPINFLQQVRGYRPLQAHLLTLEVAASQLVLLPLTAVLLDFERVDSRWVSACGYVCILIACAGGAHVTSDWDRSQFVVLQLIQSVGFSFVVMPLLMMATNSVTPKEGPYAAAMVNTPRAIAEALGVWVLELVRRRSGAFHRTRITEIIGADRLSLAQTAPLTGGAAQQLSAGGGGLSTGGTTMGGGMAAGGGDRALDAAVTQQVTTLVTLDTFLVIAAIVLFLMMVLAFLPKRTYPPRIALA